MKPSDVDLARRAVARGWISQEQSLDGLAEADRCQAMGLDKGIGDVLLERGLLSARRIAELRASTSWSLEESRLGGYEVQRRIGLGGTGNVFEARHVRLNQRVALKVLSPRVARDAEVRAAFLREARALARLSHPNLVHAFDFGKDGSYYYLGMEYVEGESLQQRIARLGRLPVVEATRIVRDVCRALVALAARGLVHGDVKPANVLLGNDGEVKLTDLGLVRRIALDGTEERVVRGTPHYISPEEVAGSGRVDARSDLYSLGATWYHAIAGRPPFLAKSTAALLRAHQQVQPASLASIHPDEVPPEVDRVVLTWLQKDPSDRPPDAAHALGAVERLLDHLGSTRASTYLGRRMWIAGGVIAVALAAIGYGWHVARSGDLRPKDAPAEGIHAVERDDPALGERAPEVSTPSPFEASVEAPSREVAPPVSIGTVIGKPGDGGSSPGAPSDDESQPIDAAPTGDPVPPGRAERGIDGKGPAKVAPDTGAIDASALVVARPSVWPHLVAAGRRVVAAADALPGFGEFRVRSERSSRLLASITAAECALVPGSRERLRVLISYSFERDAERFDFRARPGSIRLRDGAIVTATRDSARLTSTYWLTPPVRIRGQARAGSIVSIGMTDLDFDPRRWSASPAIEVVREFRLEWSRDAVSFEVAGEPDESKPLRRFDHGRLALVLQRGGLDWLEVEGDLEPAWVEERARLVDALGE